MKRILLLSIFTLTMNFAFAGGFNISISNQTNPLCAGVCTGTATIEFFGGVAPYDIDWDGTSNDETGYGSTTHTATGLCGGGFMAVTYFVTVTDDNGATASTSASFSDPQYLNVSLAYSRDPSCNGSCDGEAEVILSGGTAPYDISWDNNGADDALGTLILVNRAFALCGNTLYTAQVTDANGCIATASTTLTEPAQVVVLVTGNDPVCNGDSNGDVRAAAGGGTSNFTYVWDDLTTTTTITGLPIG
ncbi:MAG: SprB repeat-containing protein, partial [Flavobacteriales bacterium]|nr:SprB repeat-containing protein [Flavobacteriales bacterium]